MPLFPAVSAPWRRLLLWLCAWLWLLGAAAVGAQEADPAADTAVAEPPGRVAAVVWVEGSARLQRDGEREPVEADPAALPNWPLTAGDLFATGPGGRAELEIGALRLRLGGDTVIQLQRLDAQGQAIDLRQGQLAVLLPQDEGAGTLHIRTPSAWHRPQGAGQFRFDAGAGGESATAWRSPLVVAWEQARLELRSGQRAEFLPEGGWRLTLPQADAFAAWALLVDAQPLPQPDARLPAQMSGAARLQQHGDWERHPEWGWIWWPRTLPPDWAPYRQGRWAWITPWGWTWIDAAPWGFAPFHYGRWLRIGLRWAWWPGDPRERPVYRPAPRHPPPWLAPPPTHRPDRRGDTRGDTRDDDRRGDRRPDLRDGRRDGRPGEPPGFGRDPRDSRDDRDPRRTPRPGEDGRGDGGRDLRPPPGPGHPPERPRTERPGTPEGRKQLPGRGREDGPRWGSPGEPGPAGRTPDIPARPLPREPGTQRPDLPPRPALPTRPADGTGAGRESGRDAGRKAPADEVRPDKPRKGPPPAEAARDEPPRNSGSRPGPRQEMAR